MADYLTTDTELTYIADAIREKSGTSEPLMYPIDFVAAIENIDINPITVTVNNATTEFIENTEDDYLLLLKYGVPQSKTVTPSATQQVVRPDSGYDFLSQVTVNAIPYTETDNSAGGVTVSIASTS